MPLSGAAKVKVKTGIDAQQTNFGTQLTGRVEFADF